MTTDPLSLIGYLGIPGTYSHQAAEMISPNGSHRGYRSFNELFDAMVGTKVLSAVFPRSNSATGDIPQVKALLKERSDYREIATLTLPIEHNLIVKSPEVLIDDLDEVLSHPQGFLQCETFMSKVLSQVIKSHTPDTASAVKYVSNRPDKTWARTAAIGSRAAANFYRATVLISGINDDPNNTTTFSVLAPSCKS